MKSADQLIDELITLAFAEDIGDGDYRTSHLQARAPRARRQTRGRPLP